MDFQDLPLVEVSPGGLDAALKNLRRRLNRSGFMKELKNRRGYRKPSLVRREHVIARRKRQEKKQQK